ncbi:MAG: HAMP domain-containing histidine kinase [Chlorobi bacterium]|nr:HAMP domain-containing histidine kinase [Chlorobiota bacterium]
MPKQPVSANIKISLIALASIIVLAVLFYTHDLVNKLASRETAIAHLYAVSQQYLASERTSEGDVSFIFDEIINSPTFPIDFPLILSDRDGNPISSKNIDLDSTLSEAERDAFLREQMKEFAEVNDPIVVAYQDTIILQYIYYDESSLVKQLRLLPYVEILVVGLFIIIGYVGFSHIKRNEQSNIWVGMAKETAHQLGTPLSSLMGWTELLKEKADSPEEVRAILEDMKQDVERLNRITQRFSKIGSKPQLQKFTVEAILTDAISYFQRRLPQTGKHVEFIITGEKSIPISVNPDLFSWVLENLIKNALDAMENGKGKIVFTVTKNGKWIDIDVQDTGRGIDKRFRKDIFRPGYSTKKRGWGLGLSLAKRIVEDYHKGKLVLHSTSPAGTTFRIRLHEHV